MSLGSKAIYKYEIHCCNTWKKTTLPKGAKVLSALHKEPIQFGDGILIYAETDVGQTSTEMYAFIAIGTGREFEITDEDIFLGTVRIPSPINEVYHVYYHKVSRCG